MSPIVSTVAAFAIVLTQGAASGCSNKSGGSQTALTIPASAAPPNPDKSVSMPPPHPHVPSAVGKFQMLPINSQPHQTRGQNVWLQEVALDPTVQQYSLELEATDSLSGQVVNVVVYDDTDIVRPITNESFSLRGPIRQGALVDTPTYMRRTPSALSVYYSGGKMNASQAPARVRAVIVERNQAAIAAEGDDPNYKSLSGEPGPIREFGQGLARLVIRGDYCTGFAIASNLLITNYHCVDKLLARGANPCDFKIQFNFVDEARPQDAITATCTKLVASNSTLDYAIFRFSLASGTSVKSLKVSDFGTVGTSQLAVLQHPEGLSARVSRCDGPLAPVTLNDPPGDKVVNARLTCKLPSTTPYAVTEPLLVGAVQYSCPTEPGSSGSPVMANGVVVALHFSSDYRYYDENGDLPSKFNDYRCLVADLNLKNWGRDICVALKDAQRQRPTDAIPGC